MLSFFKWRKEGYIMKLEELLTLTERLDQLIDECAVIYQRHREENKKETFIQRLSHLLT
ncbi:hypothetical protein [Bacillus coahuilensis]|uniref:hypothetical protein n=1 Tax=Bacillus coahuilensis TaxID=408580 RepID=UPI000AF311B5|nr:hypothetical protein [Bacillus coahuilensis]